MSDSAAGPLSGYLFQFEKALILLATLENVSDVISIEMVDDVAIQNDNDVVLVAVQAKHSISPNGSTFEDTSESLWRTLQIWIQKLEAGIFNTDTKFICSTNKEVEQQSLLYKIANLDFPAALLEVNTLLHTQKEKLKKLQASNPDAGPSIKKTIKLIEFALAKQGQLEIIAKNIQIHDKEDLKSKFFIVTHMTSDEYTSVRKETTFESMYGWIANSSKAKWLNSINATFSKKDFDTKLAHVYSNPAIVSAVFRKKSWLGSIDAQRISEAKKELFVVQIDDIKRNRLAKERKIETAILDFLYHDIEMAHIITNGNFTQPDFDQFRESCRKRWQDCYDSFVTKELDEYDIEAKNELAIQIFHAIMDKIQVSFQEGIPFTSENRYIHNGTFLKLSNIPEIGWHPEWEEKYKK